MNRRARPYLQPGDLIRVGARKPREPALLECEAAPSCGRWVLHVFARLREISRQPSALAASRGKEVDQVDYEEVYRCTRCKCERRWGLIAKEVPPGT